MSSAAASSSSVPAAAPRSLAHEGVRLVMTNHFTAANSFFAQHSDDPKVNLLSSLMSYLSAVSSHSDEDLNEALNSVWATEAFARKQLVSSSHLGDSIEGELIQADCHMLGSMIQFVQASYLKVAWNIRKSYNFYHHAEERIEKAEADGDLHTDRVAELKGWMQFGVGMFQMVLSLLPPSVMKVAEWVGFGGDRETAFSYLQQSQQSPSFMAPFACLLLLSYYLTVSTFTGQEDPAFLVEARRLLDWAAVQYPDGAFFALMDSRYYRMKVEPRKAIEVAQKALLSIKELPSISILYLYQCGWCALFLLDWRQCALYFDALLHSKPGGDYGPPPSSSSTSKLGSGDSHAEDEEKRTEAEEADKSLEAAEEELTDLSIPPTKASAQGLYAYQTGLSYAMLGDLDRARWYLEGVPSWLSKRNKAIDLFAVRKAFELLHRPALREAELTLDVFELLYCWNGFTQTPAASLKQLRAMLGRTGAALQKGPSSDTPPFTREDLCRYLLYSAALTALTDPAAARVQLEKDLKEHEAFLEHSQYAKQSGLLAFFYLELANECFAVHDVKKSKKCLDKARGYKNYDLYDIAQLKIHAHTQKIKRQEDEEARK